MAQLSIVVLGGSFLQTDFVETALDAGMNVFVLDGNKNCYLSSHEGIEFHPINFSQKSVVREFYLNHGADLLYAPCNEVGNLISAQLADELGFRYNAEEVVKITLNKSLQREKAAACQELYSPKSLVFKGDLDVLEKELSFPMVVKPTSSSAGRGITGVNNREELEKALVVAESYLGNEGIIIVEEYIGGDQISVETVSVAGTHHIVGITQEIVGPAPLFIERNHYMDQGVHNKFVPLVEAAVKELLSKIGIQYGPCHIEMKLDGDKVALIEVASRAGGLRDRLMKLAGYTDYNKIILDSFLKGKIDPADLHSPSKHGLVNILTKVEDLHSVRLGKRDETLDSLYLYDKGPEYQPQNIIDAYGYAYFTGHNSLFDYSLEHY
ncbi:ATP-grasp domain-containing protein [Akkermansiaceae bacterium]|nr:ATP-grasp domain-containing protein [Akkermansiaceae bacterium]